MHSFVRKLIVVLFFLVVSVSLLTAQAAPVIQGIDFDPRGVGASDCVFGGGFGATQSSSSVAVNGVQAAVINWSDGQVCYTIPSSTAVGAATVQVTTSAGSASS